MSLTRGQALDLIYDTADENGEHGDPDENLAAMRRISIAWIGHDNGELGLEDLASLLREYVDERCVDGDHIRSYGPSDSDMTDLEDPT